MDYQINIQKRKQADIIQDVLIITGTADNEDTIIIDTRRYGLPSIIEDDPDDSDIDQPDNKSLEKLILFWSTQLIFSQGKEDKISLGKLSIEHQMKDTLNLLYRLFIM